MRLSLSPREAGALARSLRRRGPTLAALAEMAAHRFGSRTALVVGEATWSFEDLWGDAERLAAQWHREVLERPRTIVAACDGAPLVLAVLAAGRLGLDAWLANPRRIAALDGVAPRDALLVHPGDAPSWHAGPTVAASDVLSSARVPQPRIAGTRRVGRLVLMTAGTTGAPTPHVTKPFGVRGMRQLEGLHRRVGIASTDTVLGCAPLHHGHGVQLLAATLLTGATLVSSPGTRASTRLRLMGERGVTVVSGVPTQLERLVAQVEDSGAAPPTLRRIVSGSEPLDAALVARLHAAWGPVVMNAYGTTETGTVAVATPDDVERHPDAVGRALPGTQMGIVGHPQGSDAEGRVWLHGAGRTVITDDAGRIVDGSLTLLGRLDPRE
ncbi:class I adenylate-forming enzyme family protein [Agrococcus sp. SGAir0287]|uniref:class I adenylate-forming enzyme family protein n=1 Tax=Agrococcus sp. SGAir0287 TaxID=2070347 RepID=UPI001586B125|nr:AMP-binding protein [Agrococcus sp. SGAir0287]